MYFDSDKSKVVTVRITQSEYDLLKAYVDECSKRFYWPRKTISSVAGAMIVHCLRKKIDVFSFVDY